MSLIALGNTSQRHGGFRAVLLLDQLDTANFPRDGWTANVDLYDSNISLGAEESFRRGGRATPAGR